MPKEEFALRGGLVAHMRLQSELEDELSKYFYFKSPLWKAIIREVYKGQGQDSGLVKPQPDMHIPSHRGTGPSVSCKSAWMPGMNYLPDGGKEEQNYFGIRFVVGWVYNDDTSEHPQEKERTYDLNVPVDLETNFTQEKFDAWVATLRAERDELDRKDAKRQLDEIKARFPDLFDGKDQGKVPPPIPINPSKCVGRVDA